MRERDLLTTVKTFPVAEAWCRAVLPNLSDLSAFAFVSISLQRIVDSLIVKDVILDKVYNLLVERQVTTTIGLYTAYYYYSNILRQQRAYNREEM